MALVADVVAKQLQNLGGGNGRPAAAQPVRARETWDRRIDGVTAELRKEVVLVRSPTPRAARLRVASEHDVEVRLLHNACVPHRPRPGGVLHAA